jgi:hypothetical protein
MRSFIALLLISFNAIAVTWNDLETQETYKLTQSFQLPQTERSGSLLDLLRGDRFVLKAITGLDMINVSLFTFELKKCPGPALKTDMEIIPVDGTTPVVEIGAQIAGECKLEIFIENKDLMTNSFFE